jgi:mRNA deadenylase 3'-5' endonuclease subunit Ccr4
MELRILTFNILAPMWVQLSWYESRGVQASHLLREFRIPRIISTVLSYDPDIAMLQEVQLGRLFVCIISFK